MNTAVRLLLAFFFIFYAAPVKAEAIVEKGFISMHLKTATYNIDTGASAVILFEKEDFQIFIHDSTLHRQVIVTRVVRILKEDAFSLANLAVLSFSDAMMPIEAATYNLVNGTVVKTDLDKNGIVRSPGNGLVMSRISLPDVRKGCIIAYRYEQNSTVVSRLYSWAIQGKYPKLKSEYCVTAPLYTVGFEPICQPLKKPVKYVHMSEAEEGNDDFATASINVGGDYVTSCYIRRNIPAFKEEKFMLNGDNYKERQDLYLVSSLMWPANTWTNFNEQIWDKQGLGSEINGQNLFFILTLDSLLKQGMNDSEKTVVIYRYVRNNFAVDNKAVASNVFLKNIWETRTGNIVGINTLLTAMLVKAKLLASPVMIATMDNLSLSDVAPVAERINYMVCVVKLGNSFLLLDASGKNNFPGVLPLNCYNGYAWVLGEQGHGIVLDPVQVENKDKFYTRIYDISGSTAKVDIRYKAGMLASYKLRKQGVTVHDVKEECLKQLKQKLPQTIDITSQSVDNVEDADANLVVKLSGTMQIDTTNGLALQQNMAGVFTKNPFSNKEHDLPIDFPFCADYMTSITIELKDGFVLDSTLGPINVSYDSSLMYQRVINVDERIVNSFPDLKFITVTSNFTMARTRFDPAEYPIIKDFFEEIVTGNNSKIYFRKQKK